VNLLIVDDHATNLKLLRAQLEAEGHTVFEAHDGVDALALLNRQRVDAVISDILMPRMDGYRLCDEMRAHARLHDLPIIIFTSTYTSPSDVVFRLRARFLVIAMNVFRQRTNCAQRLAKR
jgi:CheY-like chemotaxis protein